jgi:hypothetical protein
LAYNAVMRIIRAGWEFGVVKLRFPPGGRQVVDSTTPNIGAIVEELASGGEQVLAETESAHPANNHVRLLALFDVPMP